MNNILKDNITILALHVLLTLWLASMNLTILVIPSLDMFIPVSAILVSMTDDILLLLIIWGTHMYTILGYMYCIHDIDNIRPWLA